MQRMGVIGHSCFDTIRTCRGKHSTGRLWAGLLGLRIVSERLAGRAIASRKHKQEHACLPSRLEPKLFIGFAVKAVVVNLQKLLTANPTQTSDSVLPYTCTLDISVLQPQSLLTLASQTLTSVAILPTVLNVSLYAFWQNEPDNPQYLSNLICCLRRSEQQENRLACHSVR